jgi:hypothetical protein
MGHVAAGTQSHRDINGLCQCRCDWCLTYHRYLASNGWWQRKQVDHPKSQCERCGRCRLLGCTGQHAECWCQWQNNINLGRW